MLLNVSVVKSASTFGTDSHTGVGRYDGIPVGSVVGAHEGSHQKDFLIIKCNWKKKITCCGLLNIKQFVFNTE